jgi:hypothetical protein
MENLRATGEVMPSANIIEVLPNLVAGNTPEKIEFKPGHLARAGDVIHEMVKHLGGPLGGMILHFEGTGYESIGEGILKSSTCDVPWDTLSRSHWTFVEVLRLSPTSDPGGDALYHRKVDIDETIWFGINRDNIEIQGRLNCIIVSPPDHFLCFVVSPDGQWWKIDDEKVTAASLEEVNGQSIAGP